MKALAIAAAALLAGAPAAAQTGSAVPAAVASGQVGERFDGYLGYVSTPAPVVRRQVAEINILRRNLYIQLAASRNVTADVVGLTTGCELLSRIAVGQAYMLRDGAWRRRAAGEPAPAPDYCR